MTGQTVAIIQARMGSTRLPGKVLKDIGGVPMLAHVVTRARLASLLDKVVVATTTEPQDQQIVAYCKDAGFDYGRGSEADVLDRYYQIAKQENADTVVRITSDCPLTCPSIIDQTIRVYQQANVEYVNNKLEYANGFDVEAIGFETLEEIWDSATTSEDREHVTPYIRRSDSFDKRKASNPLDTSQYSFTRDDRVLRLSVDYQSDIEFVREIFQQLQTNGEWTFGQQAIFELFERQPAILEMTEHASPEDFTYD